jgi:DNA-binding NtrC family response regulator
MADILVVDDEIGIRELLSEILGDEGHSVLLADCAQQARQLREAHEVDLVLLDIWMPDIDGVTLLREWAAAGQLSMPVIMMSGHATIDTAVEATRIGALDFLEKPISLQKLLKTVEHGLARRSTGRGTPRGAPPVSASAVLTQAQVELPPDGPVLAPLLFEAGGPVSGRTLGAAGPSSDRPGLATAVVATAGGGAGEIRELTLDLPLREARDLFERAYFEHHLAREQGSMTRVAEKTGLERTHLYRKLKQLGIDLARGAFRKGGSVSS